MMLSPNPGLTKEAHASPNETHRRTAQWNSDVAETQLQHQFTKVPAAICRARGNPGRKAKDEVGRMKDQ
jgi:hypothetical protein